MLEYTNIFHTLRSKLGIRDCKQHLVLKYRSGLHWYIQSEMDFLDISSLGANYPYAVKIEQKFKKKNKRDFGSVNQQQKSGKSGPNSQPRGQRKDGQSPDSQSKPQTKKGNGKSKKDTGKWCKFYKSPWHNTDECYSKQSLLAEKKSPDPEYDSDTDVEKERGKQIIDAEPSATIATAKIQEEESEELEEVEYLFHSQL